MPPIELGILSEDVLLEWVAAQRWFASKARDMGQMNVLDTLSLDASDARPLTAAFLEARFPAGTHELYQLLVSTRPAGEGWSEGVIATVQDTTVYDALADPAVGAALAALMERSAVVEGKTGQANFHWTGEAEALGDAPEVRSIGVEQSNSSIVFDERLILKVFRRLEPGDNPELEMVRFLSAHGFENIASLAGWYEFEGELLDATLGVLQDFIADGRDGWEMTLEDPDGVIPYLAELGEVTGRMHTVLASDMSDPDFAPEEPSDASLSILTATIDEEIERLFVDLPSGMEALEPIAGRGEEVRDRLQTLSHVGVGGRAIRSHGDYHLGQTLRTPDRWVLLDFEGEPARSLIERRRKRSPLRDVAGMLRSFAYAASAMELGRGQAAPEDWEQRAREAFLEGYLREVEPSLLPAGQQATEKLLSIFELEKAVYELRYELNNRPDWVAIPVAGIARLLEEPLS
jgi:maltokinase